MKPSALLICNDADTAAIFYNLHKSHFSHIHTQSIIKGLQLLKAPNAPYNLCIIDLDGMPPNLRASCLEFVYAYLNTHRTDGRCRFWLHTKSRDDIDDLLTEPGIQHVAPVAGIRLMELQIQRLLGIDDVKGFAPQLRQRA